MDLKTSRVDTCPPDHHFPGWKVEIVADGESISRLWVVDKQVRLGAVSLRTGCISSVGTDEKYRGQGLANRVMAAALELMKREGLVLSLLHGIADFYEKHGYACCMPEYEMRLTASDLEKRAASAPAREVTLRLREAAPGDLPAVARLYNRENALRPGTIVRDPAAWKGFPRGVGWFTPAGARVVVDARDRIKGYVVFDAEVGLCRVAEAGGSGAAVQRAILGFLGERARALPQEEIVLILPPDHALSLYCRDLGCRQTVTYSRSGQFMGLVLDERAFRKEVLAGIPAQARVRLDGAALLQLVLGYRNTEALSQARRLQGPPAAITALARRFAPRFACMYWPDRF